MHTYDLPLLTQLEAEVEAKRAGGKSADKYLKTPLEKYGLGRIARRRLVERVKASERFFPCWYNDAPKKNNEHVDSAVDDLFSSLVGMHETSYPTAADFFKVCSIGGSTKKSKRSKSPGPEQSTADGTVASVAVLVEVQ
jgi:hypothetical protein